MYKPLPISYPLPDYVQDSIHALLDYLNTPGDHTSDDIYRTEVQLALRDAYASGKITERAWEELKDYYVWKGYDKQRG